MRNFTNDSCILLLVSCVLLSSDLAQIQINFNQTYQIKITFISQPLTLELRAALGAKIWSLAETFRN